MNRPLSWMVATILAAATALVACNAPNPGDPSRLLASADQLEADVRFLADDRLEGREAGTRGYDLAALYVRERFRALGLEPGGYDGGYFQAVPMLAVSPGSTAELTIGDIDLISGEDYVVYPSTKGEFIDVSASLVFGGMCFESERENRNDFEGLDLAGKIAACISGAPKYLDSETRAHYRSTQSERLSDLGTIGKVSIYTQSREEIYSFEKLRDRLSSNYLSMQWLSDDGTPFSSAPSVSAYAMLSLAGAEKVFAAAGRSWEEIHAAAESESGDVAAFDLGMDARIRVGSSHQLTSSDNVIGILPGSDPELSSEYVILIAHLDHIGVNPSDEEGDDEISNGAMDNATGISAMLEVARLLKAAPPKRSIVFIALTAEEKGLNGSEYFARNPTVPADDMVAVVNLDMPIVTYDFTDIVAYGVERSTLYDAVKDAAEAHGVELSPDPVPEEGLFTRSDHYMFVKQGVPAVWLKTGIANGGEKAQADFRKNHYHEESDEADLVDFEALRRFTDIKADVARNIADMPQRPVWNAGDFFGTTFGGPMATE